MSLLETSILADCLITIVTSDIKSKIYFVTAQMKKVNYREMSRSWTSAPIRAKHGISIDQGAKQMLRVGTRAITSVSEQIPPKTSITSGKGKSFI